jgi:hypothetical protein
MPNGGGVDSGPGAGAAGRLRCSRCAGGEALEVTAPPRRVAHSLHENTNRMQPVTDPEEPAGSIAWVAMSIHDPDTFARRARAAAERLGLGSIDLLPRYFHQPPRMPPDVAARFPGLGDWMSACQFACFEILYHFREAALPLLRRVAFGPYDWTQARAVEILCRLAKEGLETERIASEIAEGLPHWRYEAVLHTIQAVSTFARCSSGVQEALDRLIHEWAEDDPIDALELVEALARNAPEGARQHERLLRQVMETHGWGTREPLADGQIVEVEAGAGEWLLAAASGSSYPSLPDYHAIRAALVLRSLFPEDAPATLRLGHWAASHPDAQVRRELKEHLGQPQYRPTALFDPRMLYPKVLRVEWGWTPEQCLAKLAIPPVEVRDGCITLRVADAEEEYFVLLVFWDPAWLGQLPRSEVKTLQSIQVTLYDAAQFSPEDFLPDEAVELPQNEEFWANITAEHEAELAEARSHFERVQEHYQETLGPASFVLEGDAVYQQDLHTKAISGWREPGVNVELSLEHENGGDWPLDVVRLTLEPPRIGRWVPVPEQSPSGGFPARRDPST